MKTVKKLLDRVKQVMTEHWAREKKLRLEIYEYLQIITHDACASAGLLLKAHLLLKLTRFGSARRALKLYDYDSLDELMTDYEAQRQAYNYRRRGTRCRPQPADTATEEPNRSLTAQWQQQARDFHQALPQLLATIHSYRKWTQQVAADNGLDPRELIDKAMQILHKEQTLTHPAMPESPAKDRHLEGAMQRLDDLKNNPIPIE